MGLELFELSIKLSKLCTYEFIGTYIYKIKQLELDLFDIDL